MMGGGNDENAKFSMSKVIFIVLLSPMAELRSVCMCALKWYHEAIRIAQFVNGSSMRTVQIEREWGEGGREGMRMTKRDIRLSW